ncbi:MAG: OmpH family outer membrane protein [FCB group bacterium]|nr:OmpH family outer membrane protein [FCB group bacterium]
MKSRFTFLMSLAVIILMSGGLTAKELKIGFIDSDRILAQFQDYLDAKRILENEEKQYSQNARQMENDIRALEDEIESQSLMWSNEKKMEKQSELQTKYMGYQQYIEEIWGPTGKLYQRNMELSKPIIDKINLIIKKIGEDEGYDFIFDATNGSLVHAKDEYDLTDRVIEELSR